MIGEIKVISGSAHPELGARHLQAPRHRSVPLLRRALLEREPARADRRERARGRRVRDPALLHAGLGRHPRAADHDRRAEARLGRPHHRGAAVLPVRALRQEGPPAHLDHRAPDGRPAPDRGRRPRAHHGPALAAGAGLLPHPGRPAPGRADPVRPPAPEPRPHEPRARGGRRGRVEGSGQLRQPPEPADRDRGQAPLRRRRAGARDEPDRRRRGARSR